MSQSSILFPALMQALLTLLLLPLLGAARARSMREHKQGIEDTDVRLGTTLWSEEATKISSNYKNQFEVPVLFFAVIALALVLKQVDSLMTNLAWAFALSRLAHSAIHIGPNIVKLRAMTFLFGVAVLITMWLVLGWRVWNGA